MLVLGRKKNESLVIGDNIEVTVTEIQGNRVRLGIVAPRHITVHRKEVWLNIKELKPSRQLRIA
jgi:carbon storage regulator